MRILFLLILVCARSLASDPASIARVENGLLPPARIANSSAKSWTLAERMAFYHVPGVSVAIINNGELEWARGYGDGRVGNPAPVTPNTPFHCATLGAPLLAASDTAGSSALLRERALLPLAMTDTAFDQNSLTGLSTTPSDLARFALGLQRALDGKPSPFTRRTVETLFAPQENSLFELKGNGVNFSYRRSELSENLCAFFVAFPHSGQGAVVMLNSGQGAALAGEILRAIAREYRWPDYQVIEKTAVTLALTVFEDLAGIYARDAAVIRIFSDGDRFYLKPRGEPRREIFPQSAQDFFFLDEPEILSFERNEEGIVTHIIRRTSPPQIFRRVR